MSNNIDNNSSLIERLRNFAYKSDCFLLRPIQFVLKKFMDPPKSEVPDTSLKNREAERTEEASSSQDSPDMASSSSVTSTEEASSSSGPAGVEPEFDEQGRLIIEVKAKEGNLPTDEKGQVKPLADVLQKACDLFISQGQDFLDFRLDDLKIQCGTSEISRICILHLYVYIETRNPKSMNRNSNIWNKPTSDFEGLARNAIEHFKKIA